jgi:cellulose synthase/poly-beta-1,6-N-acetylglucosamine synthase-like glycosyltransferase
LGALLGANGAIYAIRRSLYSPAPSETAVEDFVIPLLMRLRSRCRIVYDFDAVAREQSPADLGTEFHRRVRIGTGGFQAIRLLHPLLNPRHGWVAYTFFSHKVLRWLCPFLLLVMLVASGLLGDSPVFKIALAAQIGFYGLSLLTALLPARMRSLRVMRLAHMFTSMNAALLLGFCRWAAGSGSGVWRRTPRPADVGA